MQAARRRAGLIFRAGSAGGPKPGRAGFYLELGCVWIKLNGSDSPFELTMHLRHLMNRVHVQWFRRSPFRADKSRATPTA